MRMCSGGASIEEEVTRRGCECRQEQGDGDRRRGEVR